MYVLKLNNLHINKHFKLILNNQYYNIVYRCFIIITLNTSNLSVS